MEVSKLTAGAWLNVIPLGENIEEIKIKMKPVDMEKEIEISDLRKKRNKDNPEDQKMFVILGDLILDWNLTSEGKPVDCNDENKKFYLPFLIKLKVQPIRVLKKAEETEEDQEDDAKKKGERFSLLGVEMIAFVQNVNNFLKN